MASCASEPRSPVGPTHPRSCDPRTRRLTSGMGPGGAAERTSSAQLRDRTRIHCVDRPRRRGSPGVPPSRLSAQEAVAERSYGGSPAGLRGSGRSLVERLVGAVPPMPRPWPTTRTAVRHGTSFRSPDVGGVAVSRTVRVAMPSSAGRWRGHDHRPACDQPPQSADHQQFGVGVQAGRRCLSSPPPSRGTVERLDRLLLFGLRQLGELTRHCVQTFIPSPSHRSPARSRSRLSWP